MNFDTPYATEMTGLRLLRHKATGLYWRFCQCLPIVVWPGQEVDVKITFTENRLSDLAPGSDTQARALSVLTDGALPEISKRLADIGVTFDEGIGPDGRDWEWDWSLEGPVKVTILGKKKLRS